MGTFYKRRKTWITSAHQGFAGEGIHSNTLSAYILAAQKGADIIETDARMTKDGILIVNHDADIKGYDETGKPVSCLISDTDYSTIKKIRLSKDENHTAQYVPSLLSTVRFAYLAGICINIDLKEGFAHAEDIARMVVNNGMRGRTVYATNGAGKKAIELILGIDPEARFIDTKRNFTRKKLAGIKNYKSKCYVYTNDFSDANIAEIRESGCMLAAISLNSANAQEAFKYYPDMAEYPHTEDFELIERDILERMSFDGLDADNMK